MYGGAEVLDSRSDVVAGMAYNAEYTYADQMLRPDPPTRRRSRGRPARALHLLAPTRSAERRAWPPRGSCWRVLDEANEMGYGIKTGDGVRVLPAQRRRQPLFGGYHIFNHTRMHAPPGHARADRHAAGSGSTSSPPTRSTARASSSSTWAPRRHRGPGQELHVQERRQGGRGTARPDRHLHVEADQRRWPAAARTSTSRCSTDMGERDGRRQGGLRHVRHLCRQFVAGNLKYAQGHLQLLVPTLNCDKRRRPHTFSPSNISWGVEDRSALIRIKGGASRLAPRRAARAVGLSNPYLVAAGMLAAGLLGIREGLA